MTCLGQVAAEEAQHARQRRRPTPVCAGDQDRSALENRGRAGDSWPISTARPSNSSLNCTVTPFGTRA